MTFNLGFNLNKFRDCIEFIGLSALRVSFIFLVFIGCATCQKAPENDNFSDAIGFLAKEKSLAKSYAEILVEFREENIDKYGEGIALYANAKAECDGLIEQLKVNLIKGSDLDGSSDFQNKLKNAAEQRVAFTSFVTDNFIGNDPTKKNPIILAAIASAPELIDALTKVGKAIWQEYRNVNAQQKKEILDLLNTQKWKEFNEIKEAKAS
jgi:hypothetical protein